MFRTIQMFRRQQTLLRLIQISKMIPRGGPTNAPALSPRESVLAGGWKNVWPRWSLIDPLDIHSRIPAQVGRLPRETVARRMQTLPRNVNLHL